MKIKNAIEQEPAPRVVRAELLIRCPECGRENWSPAVASGICAWCGYYKGRAAVRQAGAK